MYAASHCVREGGLELSCRLDIGEGGHLPSVRTPHTPGCLLEAIAIWLPWQALGALLLALAQAVSVGSCKKPGLTPRSWDKEKDSCCWGAWKRPGGAVISTSMKSQTHEFLPEIKQ